MLNQHCTVVLVGTSHQGNIGAVARSMKNMGLHRLALVKLRTEVGEEAMARAASAADILENASYHDSLVEALGGIHRAVATTARQRRITWPVLAADEEANNQCQRWAESIRIYRSGVWA